MYSKFLSLENKGFQMFFTNGYGVSVQYGISNYCDAQDLSLSALGKVMKDRVWSSKTAEIAMCKGSPDKWEFAPEARILFPDWFRNDDVSGRMTTNEVAEFIHTVSLLPGW